MKLLADLHTHSNNGRFFHAKNTIEQMVNSANILGLEEIAITDHGFKHFFGTNKRKLLAARQKVNEINSWSKTNVVLGIEANIVSESGDLDVDDEALNFVDLLIIGYHPWIKTDFANFFGKTGKSQTDIQRVTNAYVNAINRYPVAIVSHLGWMVDVDFKQVGETCAKKGVLIEINNKHTNLTKEQVEILKKTGCLFIVSSDAHSRNEVGKVDHALEIIEKYHIPKDRVINVRYERQEMNEHENYEVHLDELYAKANEFDRERSKVKLEGDESSLSDEMEKELEAISNVKNNQKQEKVNPYREQIAKILANQEAEFEKIRKRAEEYLETHEDDKL